MLDTRAQANGAHGSPVHKPYFVGIPFFSSVAVEAHSWRGVLLILVVLSL